MSISKLFSLDLWKNKPITIDVKQNDAGRNININLKANGEEVDLTGKTVKYFIKKGDGNTVFNNCNIVEGKIGSILVPLTNQAITIEGTNEMELAIYDENGAVESTFTVYLQVTKTLIDDNAIESSNEFKALNDALGMVQGIDNKFKAVDSQLDKNTNKLSEIYGIEADYYIKPNDDPQTIIDNAPPYSTICFTSGMHEHGLTKYNSMIYIDKPLHIHIPQTATLKVANGSMKVDKNAELITNFHANNPINDLEIDSTNCDYNDVRTYEIKIQNDKWLYQVRDFENKVVINWTEGGEITTSYVNLLNGIKIKFGRTDYTNGAGCIIALGSKGYSVIRIGSVDVIDGIDRAKITGNGFIDQNQKGNAYSNLYALWLNCGLLINGRVWHFHLEDRISFKNCNRSIIVLGENKGGVFNLDGSVTGGENFSPNGITIKNTITEGSCISGVLFGMPEHRGYIENLEFSDNEVWCDLTGIEPNNRLKNYKIVDNRLYCLGKPIHCWRASENGIIKDNISYRGSEEVVTIDSPSGWLQSKNIVSKDNVRVNDSKDLNAMKYSELNYKGIALTDVSMPSGTATKIPIKSTVTSNDYFTISDNKVKFNLGGNYFILLTVYYGNETPSLGGDRGALIKNETKGEYIDRFYVPSSKTEGYYTTCKCSTFSYIPEGTELAFYGLQNCGKAINNSNSTVHIFRVQ